MADPNHNEQLRNEIKALDHDELLKAKKHLEDRISVIKLGLEKADDEGKISQLQPGVEEILEQQLSEMELRLNAVMSFLQEREDPGQRQ